VVSLADFKQAFAFYSSRTLVLSIATFAAMVVGGLLALSRVHELEGYLYSHFGKNWGGALLGLIPGTPALFVMFGGIWKLVRWVKADGRLTCPSCSKDLSALASTVIASRHCPLCGDRVLAEE
jgi:hypothetical protein